MLTPSAPKPDRMQRIRRVAIIAVVALAVIVPGALAIRFWPRAAARPHPGTPPATELVSQAPVGAPNPLAAFDVRAVARAGTRIKLWATPPGTECPYGVEFQCRSGALTAVVQRRGATERTPVPVVAKWVDLLNAAVRESSARPAERGVALDLAVEHSGELPERYLVRLDPEGPGWAVLDEMISYYGIATYTIVKNDTPSGIARKILGDARRWPEILAVNPGLKPDKLKPGDVIRVPRR